MDVNTIIEIINNNGFPIAACIALAIFVYRLYTKTNEDWKTTTEFWRDLYVKEKDGCNERMMKFNETLQKFNDTLDRIDRRIEKVENKLDIDN